MRAAKKASSRKNRKRGAWLRPRHIVAPLLVAVLGTGLYFFAHSGFFALREVEIRGNKHLSEAEVRELMKLGRRENLLFLSTEGMALRLLSSPWIRSVSVRKEFPGKLTAQVEEAEPFALLENGAGLFLMDGGGNVLEEIGGESVPFLPVIVTGAKGRDPRAFSEALALAGAVKRSGLAAEKNRVEITGVEERPEDLTLRVDGLVVRVGEGQYEKKLARLFELADEIARRWEKTEYVDLRFADRVVVKPVAGVSR